MVTFTPGMVCVAIYYLEIILVELMERDTETFSDPYWICKPLTGDFRPGHQPWIPERKIA